MNNGDLKLILDFLTELKEHNERDWFHANKKKFEEARDTFYSFVEQLIPVLREIDAGIGDVLPKDCIFRIYKDIRFSKDKTPYKTNMGAFISNGGRKSGNPGYYIHLEPGGSFIAGGVYQPPPPILQAIRTEIYYNASDFKKIISAPEFVKAFGGISDYQKLKRPPKGFPADFPDVELLKYKNYIVMHEVGDKVVCQDKFTNYIAGVGTAMFTLNKFLTHAIDMSTKEN